MPRKKVEGLIAELHDKFATSDTSPEQDLMLDLMQSQLQDWEGPQPADGNLLETVELLLEDIEEKHPKTSEIIKDIIITLKQIL